MGGVKVRTDPGADWDGTVAARQTFRNLIRPSNSQGVPAGTPRMPGEFHYKLFSSFTPYCSHLAWRPAGEGNAMAPTDVTAIPLSPLRHQTQLRRAVIASTVGTAIEWYDFFLYSTVTGLVFAKLFFPNSDPWVGTLEAFAIYAVGFVARPVGGCDFRPLRRPHRPKIHADRHAPAHGACHLRRCAGADLREHRHLGRGPFDHPAFHPRRRRRGGNGAARY